MYQIYYTKRFDKALFTLVRSGQFKRKEVDEVLALLRCGADLPANLRDHALVGDMSGMRECHVRGDILLIYRNDHGRLVLLALDIGTHHELFGG